MVGPKAIPGGIVMTVNCAEAAPPWAVVDFVTVFPRIVFEVDHPVGSLPVQLSNPALGTCATSFPVIAKSVAHTRTAIEDELFIEGSSEGDPRAALPGSIKITEFEVETQHLPDSPEDAVPDARTFLSRGQAACGKKSCPILRRGWVQNHSFFLLV
jgi:hypothetical protein